MAAQGEDRILRWDGDDDPGGDGSSGLPQLQTPVVITAFTGWNDAGDAASSAMRSLVEMWGARHVAEILAEQFTDFATVRPLVRLDANGERQIVWPSTHVWAAHHPGGDALLVLGPEPALRWRLYTDQVVGLAEQFGASSVITLGALLADVAHRSPVRVIGTSADESTRERFDLVPSSYEGPTGIVGVISDASQRRGLVTASLWAAVPTYAAQIPSPKATVAIIERVCQMIGAPPPPAHFEAGEVQSYEESVDAMVADDDDLRNYVRRLEIVDDQDDTPHEVPRSVAPIDGDGLMDEVEQFLRDQPEG